MGSVASCMCANTDFFQRLVEQYGDDFVKLIAAQKAKMVLQQKFKEVIAKLREYITIFQNKVNSIVDDYSKQLIENFQKIKEKINNIIPGGIPEIQRKKGKSINQFTGFNKMIEKIDRIRDETLQKVMGQKADIQNQLLQKKEFLYKQIEQQRPKIPVYEQLPEHWRFKILTKGEQEFKQRLDESTRKIGQKSDQSFNQSFEQMDDYFNRINPDNFLQSFVQNSIQELLGNFAGKGVGGKIFDCLF